MKKRKRQSINEKSRKKSSTSPLQSILRKQLVNLQSSKDDCIQVYHFIYQQCSQNSRQGEIFYKQYQQILQKFLSEKHTPCQNLQHFLTFWDSFLHFTSIQKKNFLYLERYFIPQNKLQNLQQVSYDLFARHLLHSTTNLLQLIAANLNQKRILVQKNKHLPKDPVMTQIIQLLLKVQLYNDVFHSFYILDLQKVYLPPTKKHLQQVQKYIENETNLCNTYLDSRSILPMRLALKKHLVSPFVAEIAQKFPFDKPKNLPQNLFLVKQLVEKTHLPLFFDTWKRQMRANFPTIKSCSNIAKYLKKFLLLQQKCHLVSKTLMPSSFLKKFFASQIHPLPNYSFQFAFFVDRIIRKYPCHFEKGELNKYSSWSLKHFGQFMKHFELLLDKHLYAQIHFELLSKRLLYWTSINLDLEEWFIRTIKRSCGRSFTRKMENLLQNFHKKKRFHLQIHTLALYNKHFWPKQVTHYNLPTIHFENLFEQLIPRWRQLYLQKNTPKNLTWNLHLGTCLIYDHHLSCTYECSPLQALYILCFNLQNPIKNFSRFIQEKEKPERKNIILKSLCDSQLLVKKRQGFQINAQFTPTKNTHIKIPLSFFTAKAPEIPEKKPLWERKHRLDCALIQLLKRQKELDIMALYSLLNAQIPVPYSLFYERILKLEERDYLTGASCEARPAVVGPAADLPEPGLRKRAKIRYIP